MIHIGGAQAEHHQQRAAAADDLHLHRDLRRHLRPGRRRRAQGTDQVGDEQRARGVQQEVHLPFVRQRPAAQLGVQVRAYALARDDAEPTIR